jgi:hypothetical protein
MKKMQMVRNVVQWLLATAIVGLWLGISNITPTFAGDDDGVVRITTKQG